MYFSVLASLFNICILTSIVILLVTSMVLYPNRDHRVE